ncbi:MAG: alternative ribosome rescue aminoacyl-tRNA hydrolase ArfB [Propylenella sp.]
MEQPRSGLPTAPDVIHMIRITPKIAIAESEILESFVRASGPGGQNVNKVATAVQLRFDARHSPSLPEPVRERLERLAGARLTKAGEVVIFADRFRTQERNRADALARLIALIQSAAVAPRPRRATKPTAASKERRLKEKGERSALKGMRKRPPPEE